MSGLIYQDLNAVEPISDSFGEQVANTNLYGVINPQAQMILTYSGSDMTVTSTAGSIVHYGAVVNCAALTWTLVSDPTSPRWAWLAISSAGAAVVVSGTPAAAPDVPAIGDRVAVALVYVQNALAIANNASYKLDKRVPIDNPVLGIQNYVEFSGKKGAWGLGSVASSISLDASFTNTVTVGLGCTPLMTLGGAGLSRATSSQGGWAFQTGTTAGDDSGFLGPTNVSTYDATMVWRGVLSSAASQNQVIGWQTSTSSFDDANDMIGFRISGTGTIQGVCDSGGAETTRDTGVTPDGTTECTLRIEISGAGTVVRFFRNNTQIGTDVTTNIPAGTLTAACGVTTSAAASKTITRVFDWWGWRKN